MAGKMVRFNDEALHKQAKIAAAAAGQSMEAYVAEAVRKMLNGGQARKTFTGGARGGKVDAVNRLREESAPTAAERLEARRAARPKRDTVTIDPAAFGGPLSKAHSARKPR